MEAGQRARERLGISPQRRRAATRSACRLPAGEQSVKRLTDVVEPQRGGEAGGGRVQQPSEHIQDALGRHSSTAAHGDRVAAISTRHTDSPKIIS